MNHKPEKWFNIITLLLLFPLSSFCDDRTLTYLKLDAGQELDINSLNLPLGLGYRIYAPYNHKIKIDCSYSKNDDGDDNQEFLYVQTDFTHDDSGGQSIHVSANFTKMSLFNHLIIELRYGIKNGTGSNNVTTGGQQFQCHVGVIAATRCECGWGRQGRIVNGNETEVNEFPSIVAFIHKPSNHTFCGGTIIHPRYIVSAGHCFLAAVYRNRFEVDIKVGIHNYHQDHSSPYTQTYQLDQIITHPDYSTIDQDNDISLVRVSRDIIFSRGVGPACLPFKFQHETLYDEDVQMVGWGTTTWGGRLSHVLRKVTVTVMDTDVCDKKIVWVNEKKLCTYAKARDACQSDSGGPVYFTADAKYYVVGIISFGIRCATKTPGVNTRVSDYLEWIKLVIEQTDGAQDFCSI